MSPTIHDFTNALIRDYGPVVERWPAGKVEALRYESSEIRIRLVTHSCADCVVIAPLSVENHTVSWEPGTAPTVSPSLLVTGRPEYHAHVHGYLTEGVWVPCGDDASFDLPVST